jgi:hypothetical protein
MYLDPGRTTDPAGPSWPTAVHIRAGFRHAGYAQRPRLSWPSAALPPALRVAHEPPWQTLRRRPLLPRLRQRMPPHYRRRAPVPLLAFALAFLAASLGPQVEALARGSCKLFAPDELRHGTYTNRDGCEVPRPEQPKGSTCAKPVDATARCRDGDWSYSQHRQGTCSHHRGVACWVSANRDCC